MTDEQLTRLRGYYLALEGMQPLVDQQEHPYMEGSLVEVLRDELARLTAEFPDILASFDLDRFYSHRDQSTGERFFRVPGVQA